MKHSISSNIFTKSHYGSSSKIPQSDLIIFGLLTFWIYTVVKVYRILSDHCKKRRHEFSLKLDEAAQEKVNALTGFKLSKKIPLISAFLFGLTLVLVSLWYSALMEFSLSGDIFLVVIIVALSSTSFYIATLLFFTWVMKWLKQHETEELLLFSCGINAIDDENINLSDEMISRWENIYNRITLFLVIALPISFSPAIGAHFVLTGNVYAHGLFALLCFFLAIIYHIWGINLIIGLINSHLLFEQKHAELASNNSSSEPILTEQKKQAPTEERDTKPERKLSALMQTDIVGYSKAMERNEQAAYSRLIEHNKIIRALLVRYRGKEVKTIGDAFLVLFDSATDAVDCAIAIQHALSDYNQNKHLDEQVLIRIGVHIGDVLITENDVFGDGVNVTSRIESLAEPGGICLSEEVYTLVRKKIQINVDQVKDVKLKNIAVAPDIYRIRLHT